MFVGDNQHPPFTPAEGWSVLADLAIELSHTAQLLEHEVTRGGAGIYPLIGHTSVAKASSSARPLWQA